MNSVGGAAASAGGFVSALRNEPLLLTECAISERLRRRADITLDPELFFTPLIYRSQRKHLSQIYSEYRNIAAQAGLPVLLCAPTWRLDKHRVTGSRFPETINEDAVSFMRSHQQWWSINLPPLFLGALIGPAADCYRPELAPAETEAAAYHRWQLERLAPLDLDIIVAQTLPSVSEATGLALAAKELELPLIISFCINRQAEVLDTTPIAEAIATIDAKTDSQPVGYLVNCAFPSFVRAPVQDPALFRRLVGIQANASSKDHSQLDGAAELLQNPLSEWLHEMQLLHKYGMKLFGGCCGTDQRYLQALTSLQTGS